MIAFVADHQHRSLAQPLRGFNALAKELAADPNRGRAESEKNRRRAVVEEVCEFSWNCRFMIANVKTEACHFGLPGPVGLRRRENFRKQCQRSKRRVLPLKHRIAVVGEAELFAKLNYLLRFVFTLHCVEKQLQETWTEQAKDFGGPLHNGRDWRIVDGKKRERREDSRDPR